MSLLPNLTSLAAAHSTPELKWDKRHLSQEHCDFLLMPMVLCMTVFGNPHNQRVRVRRDFAGLVACRSHFTDEKTRSFGI